MAINTNELAAGIKQYIRKQTDDGFDVPTPLQKFLFNEGKEKVTGGTFLQASLKGLKNKAQGFISGTGAVVNATPSQQLVYLQLNPKFYNWNINFTLQDEFAAGGEDDVIDYYAKKTDGAFKDSNRDLAQAMWGTSTTNPLAFEGMQDICATSGTAYAGLTDTDYTDAVDPANGLSSIFYPYLTTDTSLTINNLQKLVVGLRARTMEGNGDPDNLIGFTNPYLFNKMLSQSQNQQVLMNVATSAKVGFSRFNVGGCDIFMDVYSPGTADGTTSDNWVTLMSKDAVKLQYKFGLGKDKSMFERDVELPQQPILSIQHYLGGNMMAVDRRMIAICKTFK